LDDIFEAFGFFFRLAATVGAIASIAIARSAQKRATVAAREARELRQYVGWLEGWVRHIGTQLDRERTRLPVPAAPTPIPPFPVGAVYTPIIPAHAPADEAPPSSEPLTKPSEAPAIAAAVQPPSLAPPSPAPATFEEQLGLVWLTRVGAGVFVVGALFFFKYAVDNAWIGPMGRVAVGALTGLALLASAELVRPKTKPAFVSALAGIGLAVLFASVWASSAFYSLVSPEAAFGASTAVLFLGAALAARHKAETTLVVSLGAGLLNPVVLSTGKDQPVQLFAYLVLIASVTLFVSSHLRIETAGNPENPRGFRVAPWMAVFGTMAIFVGWYARFFDISDRRHTGIDAPVESLVGAYASLASRTAPLVFVFVSVATWILCAFWYRARHREGQFEVTLTVVALVMGHVASTLLLHDSPRALGAAAIVLGLGSIVALARLSATPLLLVPMGAAFVAFLAVSGSCAPSSRVTLIGVLGAWAAVYVVGLIRGASISANGAWRASSALGLFLCLCSIVIAETQPVLFVLVLALATATAVALAHKSRAQELLGTASVVALLFEWNALTGLGRRVNEVPWSLLGAAALVALVLVVGARLFLERSRGRWALLAVSAATLGWVGTVIVATWSELSMLRALAAATAGIVDLGVGAWILHKSREGDRRFANAMIGQALALFAAAAAFSQSAATITVLWALLSVVAASATAKTKAHEWLFIAFGLYAITVGRAVFVDAVTTSHITSSFVESMGREGALAVTAFRNARAYGLLASGLSLLAGAHLIARTPWPSTPTPVSAGFHAPRPHEIRRIAGVMVALAYVLVVGMLIIEVREAATRLPAPPAVPLDDAEWAVFARLLDTTLNRQRGALSMFTTLVLGASASLLLVLGFAMRDALHRYLGLGTFTLALFKLALWDVWMIERVYQIVLFTGIGGLLVAGGFLYARFGKHLVKLVREGTRAAVMVLFVLTSARSATAAPHFDVTHAERMRSIEAVPRPGDYRLEVDLDLYRQSRSAALLGDVRIVDDEQREVPYVVQAIDSVHAPPPVVSDFLDPGEAKDGTAVATWKMSGGPHCKVKLYLRGENFVRRARVETGDAPSNLHVVSEGAYVFDIGAPSSVARSEVSYPRSLSTFVRVTLAADDTRAAPVAIRGGAFACEPAWTMPTTSNLPLTIEETHTDAARKTTVVTLDAGAAGVPLTALTLDVEGDEWKRHIDIAATNYREAWPAAGSGEIYRLQPRPGIRIESLHVPLSSAKRWLRLEIANEDSAPLVVRAVTANVATRQIVFRASRAGTHRLLVGDPKADSPHYDLETILAQKEDAPETPRLALAAATPNPQLGEQPTPPDPPFTERHRQPIALALVALLVALSVWALRLLRKPD
jgi:hypothetical protein